MKIIGCFNKKKINITFGKLRAAISRHNQIIIMQANNLKSKNCIFKFA